MMLADLGAEVTKVERPGVGDETRSWGPPYDEPGRRPTSSPVNRNKSSIVLDLTDPAELAEARRLALGADVVVENFRPGLMARFGLDYEALAPRTLASSTARSPGSAAAERALSLPGYDLLIQALGGLMSITGEPDGSRLKVGVALVDVIAGLFATVGILAALEHRRDSGRGQLVEVDLFSSLLAALVNQGSAYTVAGAVPGRMGNRHPSIAPYELFDTAEGELVLAVGTDRQFAELCAVLGLPNLSADERFASNPVRVENREALRTRLDPALTTRPAAEWAAELTERRIPAGVVNDIAAAFRFAAAIGLEPIVPVPREDGSTVDLTRNPIRLSETPVTYRSAPPPLPDRGQDE